MKTKFISLIVILLIGNIASGQWTQIGDDILGQENGDNIGHAVSMNSDGTIIAVSSTQNAFNYEGAGFVKVYIYDGSEWIQLGEDLVGEETGDLFGQDVSLSADGSVIAIGADGADGNEPYSGEVKVYEYNNGTWIQIGNPIGGDESLDNFGRSVSLSGDGSILAIGADINSGGGYQAGHVKVYENISGLWLQVGQDIEGEISGENSGYAVSLSSDGSTVVIGAPRNSESEDHIGKVRVFKNSNSVWTKVGGDLEGDSPFDFAGASVSINTDGSIIAFGALGGMGLAGYVKIYENISGLWTQIGDNIVGEESGDQSGYSIDLNTTGTVIAIGAPYNVLETGHVRVYENTSGNWLKIGSDLDGEQYSLFGFDVSLNEDGSKVGIGGWANGTSGSIPGIGLVRIFNNPELVGTTEFNEVAYSIYPNPVKNTVYTNIDVDGMNIYNSLGQLVKISKSNTMEVRDLNFGLYYLELLIEGKNNKVIKVIKK